MKEKKNENVFTKFILLFYFTKMKMLTKLGMVDNFEYKRNK